MSGLSNKAKWTKIIVLSVVAYCNALAMAHIESLYAPVVGVWGYAVYGYNIWALGLFGADVWLLNRMAGRRDRRRLHVFSAILGLLLALAVVYGAYVHCVNDIFLSTRESILQVFVAVGISFFTIPLSEEFFCFFERCGDWYRNAERGESGGHPWRYFFLAWLLIFLAYVPIFLSEWPGNFVFDAPDQINEALYQHYSTHHPILHTLLMVSAYRFGLRMGNVSAGFQFYTLFQMLMLSCGFAFFQKYLYQKKVPRSFRVGAILWEALFPMNAVFSISATKDVLCAAFFLFFAVFSLRLFFDGEKLPWYSCLGMAVTGTLSCLFRNNMLYAIVVGGIFCLILVKGKWQKLRLALILVAVFCLTKAATQGLMSYTNARNADSHRESLSVPMQCMARVVSYRGGDEKLRQEWLDEMCLYTNLDAWHGYNPYLADGVKGNANELLLRSNLLNFFKLWGKVGLAFPDEYAEAILANTMGYWFPLNQGVYVSADVATYHKLIYAEDQIEKKCLSKLANAVYKPLFFEQLYKDLPILGYLFRNAPYVWLLVFAFLRAIFCKSRRELPLIVLMLAYLATCFAGPMAALRYIYCLIVCVPIVIYMMLSQGEEQDAHRIASAGDSV